VVAAVSTEEVSVVVSAAVALVLAVFAAALSLPSLLQAESGAAVVALALAVPVSAAADFDRPRIGITALILPLEVSAAQPVHSDITTEAAARLLLGHTNSAEGKTNRPDRMPAGTQRLLASRIDRLY
jgi:hypothetical protein